MKNIILFCLAVLFSGVVSATPPDLVLVISIDQFRYEYIERFSPWFGDGGFNRFLKDGATFPNARYLHAVTMTGPGYATIGTGLPPSETGIVSNQWFDGINGRSENCSEDDRVSLSAGTANPASPLNLASDSLGDRLQEHSHASTVIGVAIKDRAAILMAGRKATAAYWFDETIPGFVSSSYYRWNPAVLKFNESVPAFVASHREWTQSDLIPSADLARLVFDPAELRKHKENPAELGLSFPHPIADADALTYTPFANDLVLDFARHVIATEQLGTSDGAPDVLYVGLSANDYFGHAFGPDSYEVADGVVRTDRSLARFLDAIENEFHSRVLVVVTADHGVQAIPEVARARGIEAGRISLGNPGEDDKTIADLTPLRRDLELRLAKRLGLETTAASPVSERIVLRISGLSVYLNWSRITQARLDGERVKRLVRDELFRIRGVGAAYTNTELMIPNARATGREQAVRLSFRPDRSGDVLFVLRAGYIQEGGTTGTTHGQPVEADQHVPLMFWGANVQKGVFAQPTSPMDIASTLGSMFGFKAGRQGAIPLPCITP